MTAPNMGAPFWAPPGGPPVMVDLNVLAPDYQGRAQDLFFLTYSFLPLTASIALTRDVQISDDAAFAAIAAACVVTDTLNTTRLTFVPQLVIWQEGSSNRNLFNNETHFHNVYGSDGAFFRFARPRVFARASTVVVQHRNQEAIARNVFGAFLGFKVFPAEER